MRAVVFVCSQFAPTPRTPRGPIGFSALRSSRRPASLKHIPEMPLVAMFRLTCAGLLVVAALAGSGPPNLPSEARHEGIYMNRRLERLQNTGAYTRLRENSVPTHSRSHRRCGKLWHTPSQRALRRPILQLQAG